MMLNELEAKSLLSEHGIPVNKGYMVENASEASDRAVELGFPVVLKVLSEKITHKSDLGLVMLGLRSCGEVREAFDRILSKARSIDPEASVVVETMADQGIEVIVGAKRDPQFGPTILFGLGGIFVEVFKDVSIRVAPVDKKTALNMIREIKGYALLEGVRGRKPADLESLAGIVVKISNLMMAREDVMELDINPIMAYENGALAVDARVLIKGR